MTFARNFTYRSVALVAMLVILGISLMGGVSHVSAGETAAWEDVLQANVKVEVAEGQTWESWYQPGCRPDRVVVEDSGGRTTKDICYVRAEGLRLATFLTQDSGETGYAVKKESDEVYHRLWNWTARSSHLVLREDGMLIGASQNGDFFADGYESETLAKMYTVGNVATKLRSHISGTGGPNETKVYSIRKADKKFVVDQNRQMIPLRVISLSKNERYAAIHIHGNGVARVDLTTLEVRRISDDRMMDIYVSLAMSNDGTRIAVSGNGATYHRVYTGVNRCGVTNVAEQIVGRANCFFVDFKEGVVSVLYGGLAYNFEFSSGNDALTLYVWYQTMQQFKKITLEPDSTSNRFEYIALGDSFTSGEGDIGRDGQGRKYYLAGTDSEPNMCHISSRSYPFLLRGLWGVPSEKMRSVACSGALVMPDLNGNPYTYLGQWNRLAKDPQREFTQWKSLQNFTPGHVPQMQFVKKYKPKFITLTGGGNDVGFSDIIRYCATPEFANFVPIINFVSDCGYAKKDSYLEKALYSAIDTQYIMTKKMIEDMQGASPGARITIVGYPSFIGAEGMRPCALNSGLLSVAEITMINTMVDYMNGMLRRVAYDTGVAFVDLTDVLKGGRMCEGSRYVTGVWDNVTKRANANEQFHPNAEAHIQMARAIDRAGVYERDTSVSDSGWYTLVDNLITTLFLRMVQDGVAVKSSGSMTLRIEAGVLQPGSGARVALYSTPHDAGTYTVAPDGSVTATVPLDEVSIGYHVVAVEGSDTMGHPKHLLQFVEIKAFEYDADGDGIPDDQDVCQYIPVWYDETTGENICVRAALVGGVSNQRGGVSARISAPSVFSRTKTMNGSAGHDGNDFSVVREPLAERLHEIHQRAQSGYIGQRKDTQKQVWTYMLCLVVIAGIGGVIYAFRRHHR